MKSTVLLASLCTALAGCASVAYTLGNPMLALAQTPGEYFRQYLAKADAECREKQLGPYLPSDEPQGSPRRANATCRFMFLKPWQPGDSPESAYAHSLKLPPPHDKPVDVYKPGMSPREYFEALCAAQAGEFVFKKVERVDGIVELRPRGPESSELNRHLTAFEDPATFIHWQFRASQTLTVDVLYKYVETIREGRLVRIGRDSNGTSRSRKQEQLSSFSARYGFTWRGIADVRQIEDGIAGGELFIVDMQSNEVLAFKRSFKFRWLGRFPMEQGISATGFEWGESCRSDIALNKTRKFQDFSDFLTLVLSPTDSAR